LNGVVLASEELNIFAGAVLRRPARNEWQALPDLLPSPTLVSIPFNHFDLAITGVHSNA
jgi:hypothetical protein